MTPAFWTALDELVRAHPVRIDRPAGTPHPLRPEVVYPLDYGFLAGTSSPDAEEVDVWCGSGDPSNLVAIVVTCDLHKREVEAKLLLGCGEVDVRSVLAFFNTLGLPAMLVRRA